MALDELTRVLVALQPLLSSSGMSLIATDCLPHH